MTDVPEDGHVTLTVKSAPFMGDPEGAEKFYEAVGRLTFLWGRFEVHFTMLVLDIIQILGHMGEDHEVPISWKRRAELWRRGFNKIPELEVAREWAHEYVERAMAAANRRHALTHGSWNGFTNTSPLTAKLTSIRPARGHLGMFQIPSHEVTIDELLELQIVTDRLNTALMRPGRLLGQVSRARRNIAP